MIGSSKIIGAAPGSLSRRVIFTPTTSALTVTISLAVITGQTSVINWGDGTSTTIINSGSYQSYSHTYSAPGTYNGSITNPLKVTHLRVTDPKVSMNITGMALTYLYLNGTGSAVGGVITGMALTYLLLSNTGSAVSGALANTARLRREYVDITGTILLPTERIYGTWGETMRINMGTKLTSAETDATLIRLAAAPISAATTVYIYGAARTTASDAAYAYLITKTLSITITG